MSTLSKNLLSIFRNLNVELVCWYCKTTHVHPGSNVESVTDNDGNYLCLSCEEHMAEVQYNNYLEEVAADEEFHRNHNHTDHC